MKNYGFERTYDSGGEERVEIQQKNTFQHLRIRILCLILAFFFWLLIVNVGNAERTDGSQDPAGQEKSTEAAATDGGVPTGVEGAA